jgi:hypothetical protein
MDPRFKSVRKPCTGPYQPPHKVQTLAYVRAPMCRACRAKLANLELAPYRRRAA